MNDETFEEVLQRMNKKYSDSDSTDTHKELYKDFLQTLSIHSSEITEHTFIEKVILPMTQELYENEVEKLKGFIKSNI